MVIKGLSFLQFMTRVILISSNCLLLYNCVSKQDYDKVVLENEILKSKIDSLTQIISHKKIIANMVKLKKLFSEYSGGPIDHLVKQIKIINPDNNFHVLYDIYSNNAYEVASALKDIIKEYDKYNNRIVAYEDELLSIQKKINALKDELENINVDKYSYKNMTVIRRFDTELLTGKGVYEARLSLWSHNKIVLIANYDEIEDAYFPDSKKLLVIDAGEQPYVVTNEYGSNKRTEYYRTYRTVNNEHNPFLKRKKLSKLEKKYYKLKKAISNKKRLLFKKLVKATKTNISKIINVI